MDDIKPLTPENTEKKTEPTALQSEVSPTMPKKSRLSKSLESNSKRTLLASLLGIVVIIAIIVIFGIPFLEHFAGLVEPKDGNENVNTEEEAIVILPPFLNAPYEATNSAETTLSGTTEEGDTVKLYLNGKLVDEEKVDKDHSFEFSGIELKEGQNSFKAKTFKDKKESKFSDQITIIYRKEAPKLSVDYPFEGQGIGNKDGDRLQIEGSTDSDVNVTVNGFQAVVDDEGKFKYIVSIKGGENTLKVIATDEAGNKTEMERKFTYNP